MCVYAHMPSEINLSYIGVGLKAGIISCLLKCVHQVWTTFTM